MDQNLISKISGILTTYFAGIHKHTKKSHFSINYILQNCFGQDTLLACIRTNYREEKVFEVGVAMLLLQTVQMQKLKTVMIQRVDDSASKDQAEQRVLHAIHRFGVQQPFSWIPNHDLFAFISKEVRNFYCGSASLDILSLFSLEQTHSKVILVVLQEFLYGWDIFWADDLAFHQESFEHLNSYTANRQKANHSGGDESPHTSTLGFNLGQSTTLFIPQGKNPLVGSADHLESPEPQSKQTIAAVQGPPTGAITLEDIDIGDRRLYPDLIKVRSRKRPSSKNDTPLIKKKSRHRTDNSTQDVHHSESASRKSVVMTTEHIKTALSDLMADQAKSIFQADASEGVFQIDDIESIFQFQTYIEAEDSFKQEFSVLGTDQRPSQQESAEMPSVEPLSPKSLISSEKTKPVTEVTVARDTADDEHIFFLGLGLREKHQTDKSHSLLKKVCSPKELHIIYKCFDGYDGEWKVLQTALGIEFETITSDSLRKVFNGTKRHGDTSDMTLISSHEASAYCCINNNKPQLLDTMAGLSADRSTKVLKQTVSSHTGFEKLADDQEKTKGSFSQHSIGIKPLQSLANRLNLYSHLLLFGYEEDTRIFRNEHSDLLKRFDKLILLIQTHDLGVLSLQVVQVLKTSNNRKHQEKLLLRELVSVAVLDKKLRMIIGNYSGW